MKIAYIAAGAGGMYCGTCIHDNTVAATLMELGHDVALIPTYTPMRTDENSVAIEPVFYGAINVYLEQQAGLFRHMPNFLHRWLNGRWLLNKAGEMSGSTDASELGALTLSVLEGESGRQSRELEELIDFLEGYNPDLVHLTNCMFLGFARRMKERLGVTITSGLTGEDIFLEGLKEPYKTRVHQELLRRAGDVDAFISGSAYYADYMQRYLDAEPERVFVVPLGVKIEGFPKEFPEKRIGGSDAEFVLGYLARICPAKGLHNLIEAFHRVSEQVGRERIRLRVAGYLGDGDRDYFAAIQRQISDWGLDDQVDWVGEVDREGKIDFLRTLDLFSVPATYAESKGLYVLESMAAGLPLIQPDHGSFPEVLRATGGGITYPNGDTAALADGIVELLNDPDRRREIARAGHRAVHERYDDETMARRTLEVYETVLAKATPEESAQPTEAVLR